MTKREAKNLANEFANLRPKGDDTLWRAMIAATADHIPSNISAAFISASTNHGIWQKAYEE